MNFASIDDIRHGGFKGFFAISALQTSQCREVPDVPGVYFILRLNRTPPEFLSEGTGGHFKGNNPTVPVKCLESRWVENALVLYIGKAGPGRATLKSRLKTYVQFGQRKRVAHWGGRYIWQLHHSHDLLLCWKATADTLPRTEERRLIQEFQAVYGEPPFANLKR